MCPAPAAHVINFRDDINLLFYFKKVSHRMVTGSGVDVRITSSTDTRNHANSWTLGIANEGTSRLKSCCIIMKLDDWYFAFTNWVYISPYFNLS